MNTITDRLAAALRELHKRIGRYDDGDLYLWDDSEPAISEAAAAIAAYDAQRETSADESDPDWED